MYFGGRGQGAMAIHFLMKFLLRYTGTLVTYNVYCLLGVMTKPLNFLHGGEGRRRVHSDKATVPSHFLAQSNVNAPAQTLSPDPLTLAAQHVQRL